MTPLAGVLPPAARVVPGAGLPGLALQVVQGGGVAFHDRDPDAVGDGLPGLDVLEVTAPGRCSGVGQGAGVEQGDRFGHAEGSVPVQVGRADLGFRLDKQLGTALAGGFWLGGEHRGVNRLGCLVLAGGAAEAGLA
jgi:hypothetical protein